MDIENNININANDFLDPIRAGLIINAWYLAQSIHLTTTKSLTNDDKYALLKKVMVQITTLTDKEKQFRNHELQESQVFDAVKKIAEM